MNPDARKYILHSPLYERFVENFKEMGPWGVFAGILLIIGIILLVNSTAHKKFHSKSKSTSATSNLILSLLIIGVGYYSYEMFDNLNTLPTSIKLKPFEICIYLSIIAIGFGGIFSILSFFIFLCNNRAYDFNTKLIDYNKAKNDKKSISELKDSNTKTNFFRNTNSLLLKCRDFAVFENLKDIKSDHLSDKLRKNITLSGDSILIFDLLDESQKTLVLQSVITANEGGIRTDYYLHIYNLAKSGFEEFYIGFDIEVFKKKYEKESIELCQILMNNKSNPKFYLSALIVCLIKREASIKKELIDFIKNKYHLKLFDFYINNLFELISFKHNYYLPISLNARLLQIIIGFYKYLVMGYYISFAIKT